MDIVFCGGEIAGNFAKEVARSRRMSFDFLFTRSLAEVLEFALEEAPCNLLVDLDYVEDSDPEVLEFTKKLKSLRPNINLIYVGIGYPDYALVYTGLMELGHVAVVRSEILTERKTELEKFLKENRGKSEKENEDRVIIGVAGSMRRIGTTTACFQLLHFHISSGVKACYIEKNTTGFTDALLEEDPAAVESGSGSIRLNGLDIYKTPDSFERIPDDCSHYIVDFGSRLEHGFDQEGFENADIKVIVMGFNVGERMAARDAMSKVLPGKTVFLVSFAPEELKPQIIEEALERYIPVSFLGFTPGITGYSEENRSALESVFPKYVSADKTKPRFGLTLGRRKR